MTNFFSQLKQTLLTSMIILCLITSDKVHANNTVLEVAKLIEESYILPEIAKQTALELRAKVKAGDYDDYQNDSKKLAEVLSKDMVELSNDKHMFIEYIGSQSKQEKQQQDNKQQSFEDWWLERAPSVNFGVGKVEILKGNIGYLKYTSFYPLNIATPSIKAAMTLLKNTKGLILDLRSNGGGEEDSAHALLATFLPAKSEHPFYIEYRNKKLINELPKSLPWDRYAATKNLVVLIDGRSFSAAEATAFSLQEVERAIVVGNQSIGGAHMLDFKTIAGGFSVGVPDRRPIGKKSGKNWEGTGVLPDINSGEKDAVEVALELFQQAD